MDSILVSCGILEPHVRRRMTAHAIVASGWRQNCWNHNAWGVKTGSSWAGDFYTMDTKEDDGTGHLYDVPNDAWRSFASWREAVADFLKRISASSKRYGAAAAALVDPARPDEDYWAELGRAGYYTDTTNMTAQKFGSLCDRVASEVAKKKTEAPGESLIGPVFGLVTLAAGLAFLAWGIVRGSHG
jgi:flagellum-specific peptidoglycan hydrolase FlgJ